MCGVYVCVCVCECVCVCASVCVCVAGGVGVILNATNMSLLQPSRVILFRMGQTNHHCNHPTDDTLPVSYYGPSNLKSITHLRTHKNPTKSNLLVLGMEEYQRNRLMSWLLMPCLLVSPGYQQQYGINYSVKNMLVSNHIPLFSVDVLTLVPSLCMKHCQFLFNWSSGTNFNKIWIQIPIKTFIKIIDKIHLQNIGH